MLVAYLRTVKTASGATAVQIVHSNRRGSREIEHIGSAHSPAEVEVLKIVARQRLHAKPGHTWTSTTVGSAMTRRRSCRVRPGICGKC